MELPRTLELRCLFQGQYHAKYQRNNKRCGFKNLRCFPFCGPGGEHHEQGFCGAPITVDVALRAAGPSPITAESLHAWGEFTLRDAAPRYAPGTTFTRDDIKPLLRTETERNNPLFECSEGEEVNGVYSVRKTKLGAANKRQFSFHSHKMGYHYGWVGNKHSTNQEHAFCVYVATEVAPDVFQCLGAFHSSAFTIYCRRRHKTVSKEEKEELAPPMSEYVVTHSLDGSGWLAGTAAVMKQETPKSTFGNQRRFLGEMGEYCVEDLVQAKRTKLAPSPALGLAPSEPSSALLISLSQSSLSSSNSELDFKWMLEGGALAATYSSQARARALFLASPEFVEKMHACLRARKFSTFVDLICKRTNEMAGFEGVVTMPGCFVTSPSSGGLPFDSPEIRRGFDDLCEAFSARQQHPGKKRGHPLPSFSTVSDESTASAVSDEDDLLANDDIICANELVGPIGLAEELDIIGSDQGSSEDEVLDDIAECLFSF